MSAVVSDVANRAFAYEAQTLDGRRFAGTLEGPSQEEVHARLGALQLQVLSIQPAAPPPPRRGALAADEFLVFNQQLAHLTDAGLPIEHGLRLISLDIRSGRLSQAARDVAAELERGTPLAEAFGRHAAQFPPLYGRLVEAGAAAGHLPGMLFNLGRHMELVNRMRRVLWRVLSYPAMIMALLSLVLLFISIFVLPHFEVIFRDFRTTLPLLTELMMKMSYIYPWIFVACWAVVILIAAGDMIARVAGGRGVPWLALLMYTPILGGLLKASLLARWIDALRLGLEAGLDLPRAMSLAAEAAGDAALQEDARRLETRVEQGLGMSGVPLRRIPATVTAAVDLAGGTGTGSELPSVLHSLSRMYEQIAEHRLRVLPSILTPLLMALIGFFVVLTVVAMFLPLVKLIQSVSG